MTRKDLIKTILTPFASVIVILGSLLLVILRPVSELIVRKILADTDPQQFFQMTAAESMTP